MATIMWGILFAMLVQIEQMSTLAPFLFLAQVCRCLFQRARVLVHVHACVCLCLLLCDRLRVGREEGIWGRAGSEGGGLWKRYVRLTGIIRGLSRVL